MRQEIIVIREDRAKEKEREQLPQFPNEHQEKRKIYDKLLAREQENEKLRNRLEGALDDNHNLKLLLQSNEESKSNRDMRNSRREVSRALLDQDGQVREFHEEQRKMKATISRLEVENQRLKRENYDLLSDLKIYKKRLQEFGDVEGINEELSQKNKRVMQLNQELIENDKLLDRFEDELERRDRQIEKLKVKLGSRDEEIDQLKFKLNEYQKRLEKISKNEHKLVLIMQENQNLKDELRKRRASPSPSPTRSRDNSLMVSNADDSERIKQLELKLEDLMALIERLRAEIEDYKERYEKAMKECKFWERQRDEIAEKLNDMEALLELKKEEIMRKILTNSMMSVKIFVLMAGLKASRKAIVELQKRK